MTALIIWVAAAVVFAALEALTCRCIFVWLAAGAVAGFLTAYSGLGIRAQAIVFAAVSAIGLAALRQIVIWWHKRK